MKAAAAGAAALGLGLLGCLVSACSASAGGDAADACDTGCMDGRADGRGGGSDDAGREIPPSAVIRYRIDNAGNAGEGFPVGEDFPYGQLALPPVPPLIGATVHLSAHLSGQETTTDGGGAGDGPLSYLWYVEDPAGNEVALGVAARQVQCSFSATRAGVYLIFLEVTVAAVDAGAGASSGSSGAAPGRADLRLGVEPGRCGEDGVHFPCDAHLLVPSGAFLLGASETATGSAANERPEHAARVGAYFLDQFEVTVGRFRRFLDAYQGLAPAAGAGAHPRIAGSGWRSEWDDLLPVSGAHLTRVLDECGSTWSAVASGAEARPLNCVSWYEAFAFCVWDGGRLPTEAEWEHAAAAGAENRLYPWGEAAPSADAFPVTAVFGCFFDGKPSCTAADLPPVGNAPAGAGRWGHQDLAGSLWEWTFDRYGPYGAAERVGAVTDSTAAGGMTCDNCANVDAGEGRVFRGGDFHHDDPALLRSATRLGFVAEHRDFTRGFRCAREP